MNNKCLPVVHGRFCANCKFINACMYWNELENKLNEFIRYTHRSSDGELVNNTVHHMLASHCPLYTRKDNICTL